MRTRLSPFGAPAACFLAALLAYLSPCVRSAFAAHPDPFWPAVVETVQVNAARPTREETLARAPGFASVIPLGPEVPASRDLSELLGRVAGVHVHRSGGLGAFAVASVRGSGAAQVKVCIDGVPVSSAGEGFVNLSFLPVALFDRAEVYRGPEIATWGGPPAAGVVELATPAAIATPLHLALARGSFGTVIGRGHWGAARGPVGLLVAAEARRSRGDFRYLDRNGTIFGNVEDDREVRRANNELEDGSALVKSTWRPRAGRFDLTAQYFDRDSGVPGTEQVQTRNVGFRTKRHREQLSWTLPEAAPRSETSRRLGWLTPLADASAYAERTRDRYENRDGEVGLAKADTDTRTRLDGGSLRLGAELPRLRQRPSLRYEASRESWRPKDLLRGETGITRHRTAGTFALRNETRWGPWRLDLEHRFFRARDDFAPPVAGSSSPAKQSVRHRDESTTLGLRLELPASLALKATQGSMLRLPTFAELFGANGVQEGNNRLLPESGTQWDLGLVARSGSNLRAECVYFERRTDDEIVPVQNSQRTVKAQNLERSWARGLESTLFLALPVARLLVLEANTAFTVQDARDLGKSPTYRDKRLPGLPLREGFAGLTASRGPNSLSYETSFRSSFPRDRYNSPQKRTPGYAIHDLGLERRLLGDHLAARGRVQNLADARVMDLDGFPLPGRNYQLEITCTF